MVGKSFNSAFPCRSPMTFLSWLAMRDILRETRFFCATILDLAGQDVTDQLA
jgi:hypothetical protein